MILQIDELLVKSFGKKSGNSQFSIVGILQHEVFW